MPKPATRRGFTLMSCWWSSRSSRSSSPCCCPRCRRPARPPPLPVHQQHEAVGLARQLREQQRQVPLGAFTGSLGGDPTGTRTTAVTSWPPAGDPAVHRTVADVQRPQLQRPLHVLAEHDGDGRRGQHLLLPERPRRPGARRPDPGSFCNEPGGSCPQAIMRHPSYRGSTGTGLLRRPLLRARLRHRPTRTRISKARRHVLLQHRRHASPRSPTAPATPWPSASWPTACSTTAAGTTGPGGPPGNNADTLANTLEPPNPQKKINQGTTNTGLLGDQRLDPLPQLLQPAPRRDERHLRRRLGPVHQGHDQHRALRHLDRPAGRDHPGRQRGHLSTASPTASGRRSRPARAPRS